MSLSALPGIIATIKEDMGVVECQIREAEDAFYVVQDEFYEAQEKHEERVRQLRRQLQDMECTARTLGEYEGGAWVRQA